jgi:hypothetical protein
MEHFSFALRLKWQPLMHALGYDQSCSITCCSSEGDDYDSKGELFPPPQL